MTLLFLALWLQTDHLIFDKMIVREPYFSDGDLAALGFTGLLLLLLGPPIFRELFRRIREDRELEKK